MNNSNNSNSNNNRSNLATGGGGGGGAGAGGDNNNNSNEQDGVALAQQQEASSKTTSSSSGKKIFSLVDTHSYYRPTVLPGNMESSIVGFADHYPDNNTSSATIGTVGAAAAAPPRPRRLWKVSDTGTLRRRPVGYPPLDLKCSRRISAIGATPSVVAVRVSECLRLKGVSAEYDDESPQAIAMTTNRAHLHIHMWKQDDDDEEEEEGRDGRRCRRRHHSHPGGSSIVVECVRVSGCVMTFHRTCRAVLNAASCLDFDYYGANNGPSANDNNNNANNSRPIYKTSLLYEYPRLLLQQKSKGKGGGGGTTLLHSSANQQQSSSSSSSSHYGRAMSGLEHVMACLQKDRYDAQLLGMEYLVGLTDSSSSGQEIALYASMAVLGKPITNNNNNDQASSSSSTSTSTNVATSATSAPALLLRETIHTKWIMGLVVDRILPGEIPDDDPTAGQRQQHKKSTSETSFLSFNSCAASLLGTGDRRKDRDRMGVAYNDDHNDATGRILEMPPAQAPPPQRHRCCADEHFGGTMRSLALRVLTNALTLLDNVQPNVLMSILSRQQQQFRASQSLVSTKLVHALLDDIQKGSCRPPTAVLATASGTSYGTSTNKLSSPHESMCALVCLRILGKRSDTVRHLIVGDNDDGEHNNSNNNLEILEKARYIGSSTNQLLEEAAKEAYEVITEDVRSC